MAAITGIFSPQDPSASNLEVFSRSPTGAFSGPVTVGGAPLASAPVVTVAPDGRMQLMWQAFLTGFRVSGASSAAGPWSPPVSFGGSFCYPGEDLIYEPNGRATALWFCNTSLYTAQASAAGAWSAPKRLAGNVG